MASPTGRAAGLGEDHPSTYGALAERRLLRQGHEADSRWAEEEPLFTNRTSR